METATAIDLDRLNLCATKKAGPHGPGLQNKHHRSGCLLAEAVDELDELDRAVPILGRGVMEALLLAVRQAVIGSLVLGRRVEERLLDRGLRLFRQIRIVG